MKSVFKESEAHKITENPYSCFFEYPVSTQNISLGISEINGTYPLEGFAMDEKVEALWYVESGTGTITIENVRYQVSKGDMIHIRPGEKFSINGDALRLVVAGSPPWTTEQHKTL